MNNRPFADQTDSLPSQWNLETSLLDAIERDRRRAGVLELDAAQQFRVIGVDVRRHSGTAAIAAAEAAESRIAEAGQSVLARAQQPRTRALVEEALRKRSQLLRYEIAAHVARNQGDVNPQQSSRDLLSGGQGSEAPPATRSRAADALPLPVAGDAFGGSPGDQQPLALLRRDPQLTAIEEEFQVADEETGHWSTDIAPFGIYLSTYTNENELTNTQLRLLDSLYNKYGYVGMSRLDKVRRFASETARKKVGLMTNAQIPAYVDAWIKRSYKEEEWDRQRLLYKTNDNHYDAFRHAYWSALMTRVFGDAFSDAFATAHEGKRGNQRVREAMDLYNNAIGRSIARENPGLNPDQLADRVRKALDEGRLVVLDRSGYLEWSNKVRWLEGGYADIDRPRVGASRPRNPKQPNADAQPVIP